MKDNITINGKTIKLDGKPAKSVAQPHPTLAEPELKDKVSAKALTKEEEAEALKKNSKLGKDYVEPDGS